MKHMYSVGLLAVVLMALAGTGGGASAELLAGVAKASITPLEEKIPTLLGGYGARESKPAEGIHDTIYAKALVFQWKGAKTALVTVDACSVPINVVEESLQKAGVDGLNVDNTLMAASHSHAGLEGFSLDRRNIANNPFIGVFSEEMLDFTTTRIAQAIKQADAALQPVKVASGVVDVPGATNNRRGDTYTDDALTMLRVDDMSGNPLAVLVNFTAHGTIMTDKEMLISGGWAGQMQRTVEALVGEGVTCLYTNGAGGDLRPNGAKGGSRWEMAEEFGRRIGMSAAQLAQTLEPATVKTFAAKSKRVQLPERKAAPDFLKIAGDEYGVSAEDMDMLISVMFPDTAPIYALRIDDFEMATFPGEPICQLGLSVKDALRAQGVKHPCVSSLTTDHIGYILTKDEYHESGYEVTASFYGDGLGKLMLDAVTALAEDVAKAEM
jgi:Neutral/alkaline non-lysosomal ceramidase, N-terminal